MIDKSEFKDWKEEVERKAPIKVVKNWKYNLMKLVTIIFILEIVLLLFVYTASAGVYGEVISFENKTFSININHNFQFTQEFENYIDKALDKYFGDEE